MLLSFLLHVIAMVVPLVVYDFASVMVAFGLLGMANTLLQVSLNPLVTDVVGSGKVTGTLTLGQFVKAISSFVGPFIVAWASGTVFGWKLVFPIYAGMSLLALIWLWFTKVDEVRQEHAEISFRATFELFRDRRITLYFIGILVLGRSGCRCERHLSGVFDGSVADSCGRCRVWEQRLLFCPYARCFLWRYFADEVSRTEILCIQCLHCVGRIDYGSFDG